MKMRILLMLLLCMLSVSIVSCQKEKAADAEVKPPVQTKDVPRAAERYVADTTASLIHWTGSKPTGRHNGIIKLKEGKIFVKDSVIETADFIIDMKSIAVTDTMDAKQKQNLENHLKGLKEKSEDHFFNTVKYPTGKFEITNITIENNKTMIEGNLTIKEITKNIKFPATVTITGNLITIVSETFKIDRTLWNINFSSKSVFRNLGNGYVNDDIELKINVIAVRK
jgi:polyisoprenoid-binding protein YceI